MLQNILRIQAGGSAYESFAKADFEGESLLGYFYPI
jgi:hypothetical protein